MDNRISTAALQCLIGVGKGTPSLNLQRARKRRPHSNIVRIRELPQENRSHPAYGYGLQDFSAPWTEPATVGIPVSNFTLDGSPQKVVETCALYLQLLERLVQDSISDHARL